MSLISDAASAVDAANSATATLSTLESDRETARLTKTTAYLALKGLASELSTFPDDANPLVPGIILRIVGQATAKGVYGTALSAFDAAVDAVASQQITVTTLKLAARDPVTLALKDFQQRYKCPC